MSFVLSAAVIDEDKPYDEWTRKQNHLNYTLLEGILADRLAGFLTQGELSLLQPVYAPGKGTNTRLIQSY